MFTLLTNSKTARQLMHLKRNHLHGPWEKRGEMRWRMEWSARPVCVPDNITAPWRARRGTCSCFFLALSGTGLLRASWICSCSTKTHIRTHLVWGLHYREEETEAQQWKDRTRFLSITGLPASQSSAVVHRPLCFSSHSLSLHAPSPPAQGLLWFSSRAGLKRDSFKQKLRRSTQ